MDRIKQIEELKKMKIELQKDLIMVQELKEAIRDPLSRASESLQHSFKENLRETEALIIISSGQIEKKIKELENESEKKKNKNYLNLSDLVHQQNYSKENTIEKEY